MKRIIKNITKPDMIYLLIASLVAWILCTGPLVESLYFKIVKGGAEIFIISSGLLFLSLFLYICYASDGMDQNELKTAIHLAEFTIFISFANLVSLPMNTFRSGMVIDSVYETAETTLINTILLIVSAAATIYISYSYRKKNNIRKKRKIQIRLITALNYISAAVLVIAGLTTDKGIHTTSVLHIQMGAPLTAILIAETNTIYGLFFDNRTKLHGNTQKYKICVFSSIFFLLVAFASRSELGLPIFYVTSVLCWYFFCLPERTIQFRNRLIMKEKHPYISLSFIISMLIIVAAAILFGYYFLFYKKGLVSADKFLHLGSKLDRFSKSSDRTQVNQAISRIASSGILYKIDYVQVIEGMSDCSVSHCTHYIGLIWFYMLLALIVLTSLSGFSSINSIKKNGGFPNPIFCICLCFIILISLWNILANLGITPLIGVSCFASGYGKTHYILSGFLLGGVMLPHSAGTSSTDKGGITV